MNIKILGGGCKNCETLYKNACDAAKELGIDAEFEKVTEMKDILSFGVMKTPALVVDNVVKASGRVVSKDDVKDLLKK